jgi:ATP-binding cassette, subfamily B, bacterial PglK
MIIASFSEVITVGAVFPFLGVLTSPEQIFALEIAQPFIQLLQIKSPEELLLPISTIFVLAVLLSGLSRVALLWMQTKLSMGIGADFSVQVFERTLYQPYGLHISRNSSEILAGSQKAERTVIHFIQPILIILSSTFILVAVMLTLLAINPIASLFAFLGFGIIYSCLIAITKHRIGRNSLTISIQQGRVTKAIQEGLGSIRDVIIDGTQPIFSKTYKEAFTKMQDALASNQVVRESPRYGVEALGVVLIVVLAHVLMKLEGQASAATHAVPVLGALALGAQRLLPVLQQIYNAYIVLKGYQVSTQDALDLLEQPMPALDTTPGKILTFNEAITLKDLGFRYTPQGPWVFRHLNLKIPKGSRVGFVGVTGSGKSTLLDIVMGLLTPTEGELLIDDNAVNRQNTRAWQAHIAHVPQSIYLSDASILENIAFGVPAELVDLQRVRQSAQQAQMAQTIEGWREGYHTEVGERGVRLSGGQRQRIGIARALYKRANVLIFDEATSALDNETEEAVMRASETLGRDVTMLMIAHRITTLKNCDYIVELADGGIKSAGSYERMM